MNKTVTMTQGQIFGHENNKNIRSGLKRRNNDNAPYERASKRKAIGSNAAPQMLPPSVPMFPFLPPGMPPMLPPGMPPMFPPGMPPMFLPGMPPMLPPGMPPMLPPGMPPMFPHGFPLTFSPESDSVRKSPDTLKSESKVCKVIHISKNVSPAEKPISKKVPSMADFSVEKLQTKHKYYVDQLHEGKKCSNCNVSFKPTPGLSLSEGQREASCRYSTHLQKHFDIKRRNLAGYSRPYFKSLEDWVTLEYFNDTTAPLGNKVKPSIDVQKLKKYFKKYQFQDEIISGRITKSTVGNATCFICQDDFDCAWNDDEDDWCWVDCNLLRGKLFHSVCISDYNGE